MRPSNTTVQLDQCYGQLLPHRDDSNGLNPSAETMSARYLSSSSMLILVPFGRVEVINIIRLLSDLEDRNEGLGYIPVS